MPFGRSEKSAFGKFPVVALQAATLKFAKRIFFRNRGKILRRSFVGRVYSGFVLLAWLIIVLRNIDF